MMLLKYSSCFIGIGIALRTSAQQMFLIRGKGEKKGGICFPLFIFPETEEIQHKTFVWFTRVSWNFLFWAMRLVTHLHRLPRGVAGSRSLEMFRRELDMTLLWAGWVWRCLPTSAVLEPWFSRNVPLWN